MSVNQLSVFVENQKGRLAKITQILTDNEIDIRALSIADTTDYGILRLIVDKPERAYEALKAEKIAVSLKSVLGVSVSDSPGAFSRVMQILADADIGVDYAYAFITPVKGEAYVILRVDNNDKAAEILSGKGVKIISQEEIFG